jgi:hypothetical protein
MAGIPQHFQGETTQPQVIPEVFEEMSSRQRVIGAAIANVLLVQE